MAYCGAESLQTDNLTEGTVIENNVAINGASFHRIPFMDKFQDGLHQFSFVEGGVTVQNNLMIGGNSLHQIRYKYAGEGRAFPDPVKKVLMKNNFYGYSRTNVSFVWQGDGITPYEVDGNIYGPVSSPSTRDAYNEDFSWKEYFRVCNTNNPITIKNTLYPTDKPLVNIRKCGTSMIDSMNNQATAVPAPQFVNSGFSDDIDYRSVTFWSAKFGTADKKDVFIPYTTGDYVFYFDDDGKTRFYKYILEHAGDFDPNVSPTQWEPVTWGTDILPPLDLRLLLESFYAEKGIGFTYLAKEGEITSANELMTNEDQSLKVFPNPSSGTLFIRTPEALRQSSHITIEFYDLSGKLVLSQKKQNIKNQFQVQLNAIESGIYLNSLRDGLKSYNKKVILN